METIKPAEGYQHRACRCHQPGPCLLIQLRLLTRLIYMRAPLTPEPLSCLCPCSGCPSALPNLLYQHGSHSALRLSRITRNPSQTRQAGAVLSLCASVCASTPILPSTTCDFLMICTPPLSIPQATDFPGHELCLSYSRILSPPATPES